MARVNKLYEKPRITTVVANDDLLSVGQKQSDDSYDCKTITITNFLADISILEILSITRANLLTLISTSGLVVGKSYNITDKALLVIAVSTSILDEIAIQTADGNNVAYDITTDTITPIQQTQINGTGFVKAVGTTLSYDNNTYLTTISGIAAGGELSGTYPNPSLVNSAVTGKVLTGLSVTGSAVVSTDSVLTAVGKLQNQVNGLAGGVEYQGTWNASTNTPTLTSSVGTQGFYYVVSFAGSTNLNGITTWELGDWAIFNGTAWQKVDNTDAVVSVNGYTGIVTLSATDVSAVPTSAISGTSGTIPLFGASNTLANSLITQSGSNVTTTGNSVVTGNLTVDTNTFFVDSTNNRVGIGTTSPLSGMMHIYGTAGASSVRWSEAATTVGFVGGANGLVSGKNGSFMVRGEAGLVLSGVGNANNLYIDSTGDIQTNSTTDTGEHFIIGGSARVNGTATITGAVTLSSSMTMAGDLTTTQNGSTYYRATANNNNAASGLVMTTGNGASLQTWLIANNISGASGELAFRDSTLGANVLTLSKGTKLATFSGSIAIANTVTASVATLSTHKVTMVINGVTYYLLATT
jgi:hypothetical protein